MSVPPELQNRANLAFLAQLLAWQEGEPVPQPPQSLTMPLPEFIALLNDPASRAYVVRRLSVLLQGKTVPVKQKLKKLK